MVGGREEAKVREGVVGGREGAKVREAVGKEAVVVEMGGWKAGEEMVVEGSTVREKKKNS